MRLIDADALEPSEMLQPLGNGQYEYVRIVYMDDIDAMTPIEPEPYKEKLNEIASALSEKFAYMNTCPNERDIILGYLGVKRSCEAHCNTDCTITKCESHPSFEQPGTIRCKECKFYIPYDWMFDGPTRSSNRNDYSPDEIGCSVNDHNYPPEGFCSYAERRTDGRSD